MNGRFPQKITRRSFLSSTGKLALGIAGALAGSSGLFYYGAIKHRSRTNQELEGYFVELGEYDQLSAIQVEKFNYEANFQDAWVTKSVKGSVYVTKDVKGELLIMSPACTHLGCGVEPVPEEKRRSSPIGLYFLCPCHGAEFDSMGNSVGKVVLRGLDTYIPLIAGGKVYFDVRKPIQRNM